MAAVTLQWLFWHDCVSYMVTQDNPCDLDIWGFKVTKAKEVTLSYIRLNLRCVTSFEVINKTLYY